MYTEIDESGETVLVDCGHDDMCPECEGCEECGNCFCDDEEFYEDYEYE